MDNTLVIVDTSKLSVFHMALNNDLPRVKLTLDKEKGRSSPLLDILVYRLPTGALETSVYRMFAHSEVIIQFQSNSPMSHKRTDVNTLFIVYTIHP